MSNATEMVVGSVGLPLTPSTAALSQKETQDSLSGRAFASIKSGMSKPSFDQP